ncbi:hypothetical protein SAMN04488510_13221 [Fervidobacterium changbaicum]|uniref:Lipoprotein n=2 Tax=Fervidobacterium TaxID=2422 RepID=A0AAI8CN81_FERIS|nr:MULTISPECIES: hypothetical protein [Fervidobacterium]AMW33579.1 hypothetical protein NA23_10310 [Fervidobacterium islandicum]QAV33637.1 hypothetical protein CBS1_07830 [Fervidobacterium changbaicum]SDH77005.1 hypothetical protein SAMN04488510_13221 [Fervidobacterium changbaicum]
MKKVVITLVMVALTLLLSSCAFLLSNVLSGTGKTIYTFYFYMNGLPDEVMRVLEDVNRAASIGIVSFTHEATVTIDSPFGMLRTSTNIFGVMIDKYEIASTRKDSLTFSSNLVLSYSTDTTLPATTVAIVFPSKTYNVQGADEFYVVYDFTSDGSDVKFIKKSEGYIFEIRTKSREFVEVYDVYARKTYRLFTESVSGVYKAFFIAEKNKYYTIKAVESVQQKDVYSFPEKDGEIVDFTG